LLGLGIVPLVLNFGRKSDAKGGRAFSAYTSHLAQRQKSIMAALLLNRAPMPNLDPPFRILFEHTQPIVELFKKPREKEIIRKINKCTLYRLPPEIRLHIWGHYFSNDDYYCYTKCLSSNLIVALRQGRHLDLYKEALEIYYKRKIFHMNPKTFRCFQTPKHRSAIMRVESVLYDIR